MLFWLVRACRAKDVPQNLYCTVDCLHTVKIAGFAVAVLSFMMGIFQKTDPYLDAHSHEVK